MSNPNQLFLLADHIKLSLLERQRAQTLHIDDEAGGANDSQDGHISRSLDQFRDGVKALQAEKGKLEQAGDTTAASAIAESLPQLEKQLADLTSQFHGFATPSSAQTLTSPNSSSLAPDFQHAQQTRAVPPGGGAATAGQARKPSKTVRFSDTPPSPTAELFDGRYRDDPEDTAGYRDQAENLSNQQIHEYHSQVLSEQDEHLDRLGESIGRQRELSMQIGDELDSHVAMLDEVEAVTDRHQSRLDRAGRMLGKVARSAGENKQMTAIVVLIIILVLLIAILK